MFKIQELLWILENSVNFEDAEMHNLNAVQFKSLVGWPFEGSCLKFKNSCGFWRRQNEEFKCARAAFSSNLCSG